MNGLSAKLRGFWHRCTYDAHRAGRRATARRCPLHVEALETRCVPTVTYTYIVTTTAYSTDISHLSFNSKGDAVNTNGAPVSLFEALTAVNAVTKTGTYLYPGASVIDFDVAGSGVHAFALPTGTINPTERIAQGSVLINGYTQPGAAANTSTGPADNARIDVQFSFALSVAGSSTVVRGVALPAVALGAGSGNEVLGDFVGVTPAGASMGSSLAGVTIGTPGKTANDPTHDTVGTAAAADRNVISGHVGAAGYGVAIVGGSSGNHVQNDLIGTNLTGAAALGNAQAGVYFDASATTANAITGNVIAFNHGAGIQMAGGSGGQFAGNSIYDNAIGIALAASANAGIAAPVLYSWTPTTVTGELTKFTAGATYTLNFYNNTVTGAAGPYEGQTPWATLSVVPNRQGQFTVNVAQPMLGGLTATATDPQRDTSAFSAPTDFNLEAFAAPTLTPVEGTPATNVLIATITRDGDPNAKVSDLQAVVSWGDGTQATLTSQPSAAGQIVVGPYDVYQVRGNHTYAAAGSYHIMVTVSDRVTSARTGPVSTPVQVADAPLGATSTTFASTATTPFQGQVATFTELNPSATAKQFTATINWGDGTTSTGTIAAAAAGSYTVSGGHTYSMAGQDTVTVTIKDAAGGGTSTSSSTTVAPGPLSPLSSTIDATEGTPYTGTLGGFLTPGAPVGAQYSAVITWGNGNTTTASTAAGTIQQDPEPAGLAPGMPPPVPSYSIVGTNTYIAAGTYPVSIVVTGPGGGTTTINSTATVADAPLSSTSVPLTTAMSAAVNGVVATFTEQNPSATASQFTASINWGDGTTTTGTVTAVPGGSGGVTFQVTGNHVCGTAGVFPVTVTITDSDGGSTSTTFDNVVTPLTLVAGTGIDATAGTPFNGAIASFDDTDTTNSGSTSFTATIDWGDGHTSTASTAAGTIALSDGFFVISGTNTYATAGNYTIQIVLTGPGSVQTTITDVANVT